MPTISEIERAESTQRQRLHMHERIVGDVANHEKAVTRVKDQLATMDTIDRQLVALSKEIAKLPSELSTRYGTSETALMGNTTFAACARALLQRVVGGTGREIDLKRAKLQADLDRRSKTLRELRQVLRDEYADMTS